MHKHGPPPAWHENDALIPLTFNLVMLVLVLVVWLVYKTLVIVALVAISVNALLWAIQFTRRRREQRRLWEED